MKASEILKLVEMLHREKEIEKEIIFETLEQALLIAARKKLGSDRELKVIIDRESGEFSAIDEYGDPIDPTELGRIAAQAAKQQIIQRLRDVERDRIFDDYERRCKDIVVGTILRYEGPNLIINLGKTEGYLPRKEQVREERYQVGDRIRAFVKEVKRVGPRVRIILSRTHEEFIRRLFELEVPEIGQGIIEIKKIVREPGYRTKMAVYSTNEKVDCVGACVGVRGNRIKNIIEELGGEKIDIIRWDESAKQLIKNALKPAEVFDVVLDSDSTPRRAKALVPNNQQSLAIGKRGLNVRLASKLSDWEIDIYSERQMLEERDVRIRDLTALPHITVEMAEMLYGLGYESLEDLLELGADRLASLEGLDERRAAEVIDTIVSLLADVRAAAEQLENEGDSEGQEPEQDDGDDEEAPSIEAGDQ